LTAEPDPGTSLERRAESLPDASVPHRAGAIVSEFVASIVHEAQERAAGIVEAAEAEAASQRQAGLDGAARVREHAAALANEVPALISALRHEAESLSPDAGGGVPFQEPARPVLEQGAEAEAIAHVRAGLEGAEPETLEGGDAQAGEDEAITIVDAEVEPDDEKVGATEDQVDRLTRMTDEELARAYANAAKAAAREHDEARAASLRRMAQDALEEALRRPSFAEEPEGMGRRRRTLFPRRRRREVRFSELHEACRSARQERLALKRFAG
jgi:hypothetical protein